MHLWGKVSWFNAVIPKNKAKTKWLQLLKDM